MNYKPNQEQKKKDLQIALEIDRLTGRKVEQSEIAAAKEQIELQLALERLRALQNMEALTEDELKMQDKAIQNNGKIIKTSKYK